LQKEAYQRPLSQRFQDNWTSGRRIIRPGRTGKEEVNRWPCSSEEVFTLKLVPNKLVSKVENEFLVRAVGHPFLGQLLTYFQTNESFCDVIGYCKGGSVHSLMSRLQQFHEDLARFYAAEIILAVNLLHKCGIIHRDIKPGSILLDRDRQCKLAEFELSQAGMFKWIQKASVCGTEAYMAPEIHQGCLYGPEVDWWSVGCVMFDIILGKCVQKILSILNDIRCN